MRTAMLRVDASIPLGTVMGIAGGTLPQVLIPAAAGAVLYRQRDWFGVAFAVSWMGIACLETVLYAGDAIAPASGGTGPVDPVGADPALAAEDARFRAYLGRAG